MDLIARDGDLTMSSREIAELTGKQHKHVLDDIRKMLAELGKAAADFSATAKIAGPNGSTREIEIFELPKRETLILVSGYHLVMRARIIDRWQALEQRAVVAELPNFADPAAAARAWADQFERRGVAERQLEQQKPAVEFARAVRNTADAISIGDMARVLGIGQNRMFRQLRADHILMADNRPYQHYLDRGYFRVIESVWVDAAKDPHPTFKTLVTGRGQVYLQRKYGAEAA